METTTSSFYVSSTWKRIGANFIDGLIIGFPMGAFFFTGHFRFQAGTVYFAYWPYFLVISLGILLQIFFLKRFAQTPGKMVMGLYVVDSHSQRPQLSLTQAMKRSLAASVLYPMFSVAPAVWALFRLDRRHLIDLFAGTQVVQKMPREKAPQKRYILGSIFMFYFVAVSLFNLVTFSEKITFDSKGFYMGAQPPDIKPTREQVN